MNNIRINNIILSEEMIQQIATFQNEQDNEAIREQLDELIDRLALDEKLSDIILLRELHKFVRLCRTAAKEGVPCP